jgi:hypothetical protein
MLIQQNDIRSHMVSSLSRRVEDNMRTIFSQEDRIKQLQEQVKYQTNIRRI